MVAGVLFLMLVLLASLLAAFIYQIVTTPLTAVDAPTLVRSAAAPSVPAPALPVRQPRAPRASRPARGTSSPGGAGRQQSRGAARGAALLAVAGLAAVAIGGWLFLRIARGAAACSHQAIQICSQGFVLLTGAQLAGGAIALAGLSCVVAAIILALR